MAGSVEIVFAGLVLFCLDCPTDCGGADRRADQAMVVDAGEPARFCGHHLEGGHVPTITYQSDDEDFRANGLPVHTFVDAAGRWTTTVTLKPTAKDLCFKGVPDLPSAEAKHNLNRKLFGREWLFSRFGRFGWVAGLREVDADAPKEVDPEKIKFSVHMGGLVLGTKNIATYPSGANEGQRIRWNFGKRQGREIADMAFATTPPVSTLALAECNSDGTAGEKEYVRIKVRQGSQLTISNLPPDDHSLQGDLGHFRWYYLALKNCSEKEVCDVPTLPRGMLYGTLGANTFCPIANNGGG